MVVVEGPGHINAFTCLFVCLPLPSDGEMVLVEGGELAVMDTLLHKGPMTVSGEGSGACVWYVRLVIFLVWVFMVAWIPSAPALAGQSMAARGSHVLALLPSVALRQCRFITIFVGGNCLAAWPTLPCLGATDECKGLCNP